MSLEEILKSGKAIVLDTETTGLGKEDEVVEIAISDARGKPLFNTFIRPTKPIPPAVSSVHGITNDMVKRAPTWKGAYPRYSYLMRTSYVLVYNADFDKRIIDQTNRLWGLRTVEPLAWVCVMKEFQSQYRLNKSQKLAKAAESIGVPMPKGSLHRAMTDTLLALSVARKMVGLPMPSTSGGA